MVRPLPSPGTMNRERTLDWVATETELVETRTAYDQPTGVSWDAVQPDQFKDIPFLAGLKDALTKKRE